MATKVWIGASSAYGTGSNWVGGVAPVNGDDVVIPSGSGSIDGSDQSGTTLDSFRVHSGFEGTIGSSGTPLILDTNILKYDGNATQCWLSVQNGGAGGSVQTDISGGAATSSPLTQGLHIKCNASGDKLDPCRVSGGYTSFDEDCNIDAIVQTGGTLWIRDADGLATYHLIAGTCNYYANDAITTLNAVGGTWNHQEDAAAITTINNYGSTVNWYDDSTITTLNNYAGTFDASVGDNLFTITNSSIWGGTIDGRNGIGGITFSNSTNIYGGVVYNDRPGTGAPVSAL